jgi:hypothetical protein
MNLEQALRDLHQASDEQTEPNAASRLRAGRQVLIVRGCEAFGIEHSANLSLHDLITIAVNAPSTAARRAFAVLLVHALAVWWHPNHTVVSLTKASVRSLKARCQLFSGDPGILLAVRRMHGDAHWSGSTR